MKQTILVVISAFVLTSVYVSCNKYRDQVLIPDFKDPIITKAVNYVRDEIANSDFATLDLNTTSFVKIDSTVNSVLFIPTKDKSENKFVVVAIEKEQFKGNWLIQKTGNNNGAL